MDCKTSRSSSFEEQSCRLSTSLSISDTTAFSFHSVWLALNLSGMLPPFGLAPEQCVNLRQDTSFAKTWESFQVFQYLIGLFTYDMTKQIRVLFEGWISSSWRIRITD